MTPRIDSLRRSPVYNLTIFRSRNPHCPRYLLSQFCRTTLDYDRIDHPVLHLRYISHTVLADPQRRQRPDFTQVQKALKNLKPVNDSCERALASATKFNGSITKAKQSFQGLVLVVEAHCKKYNLLKRSELKRLFLFCLLYSFPVDY